MEKSSTASSRTNSTDDGSSRYNTGRKIYLGIDPGRSGGLACLALDGEEAVKMPDTEEEIWNWFNYFSPEMGPIAIIEKVGGFMGQEAGESGTGEGGKGKRPNKAAGHIMFTFGRNVGLLIGCLVASRIPFEEIPPKEWQGGLGIPPRKKTESKEQWKNRLKVIAQELFPSLGKQVTLATADALLIAEYCRRKHKVQGGNVKSTKLEEYSCDGTEKMVPLVPVVRLPKSARG